MCGIFGYIGDKQAEPILLEGLRTLEYRGYDSAGIYVAGDGVVRATGPIDNLASKLKGGGTGTSGIAHTRWATHGAPTESNAHPHADMSQTLWLVHNGIIENYRELQEALRAKGYHFQSETDTEVLIKLIGSLYQGDLSEAVFLALRAVRGTYGLAVMSERDPHTIVTARMGSPIVLGVGKGEHLIASDPSALLAHTKDVVYLDDGEVAVVTKDSYHIVSLAGKTLSKKVEQVEWTLESVQKNGYAHFMEKEIFEAPEVIENTLRGRIDFEQGRVKLGGLETIVLQLKQLNRLQIVGCGSAYYAGLIGRTMLETYAHLPVEVDLGSEYRYKSIYADKRSAVLAISQSGETADTRASIQRAKDHDILTLSIVNVVGSAIARETTAGVYNHAGPEVAVASTKAFLSQLTVLALITLFMAKERGMSKDEHTAILESFKELPSLLKEVLRRADAVKAVAKKYANSSDMMYIGRSFHAPIAKEGALKLKEVAYIHAEGYPAGELKHGPIAMLGPDFPVFALVPQDDVYEKMCSNIEEVRARKVPVIALATDGDLLIRSLASDVLYVPRIHPLLQPILSTVPLQLFAYYVGVERGLNVDRPRNLAKSVTVE